MWQFFGGERRAWLEACCSVAEAFRATTDAEPNKAKTTAAEISAAAAACVRAVLHDQLQRVTLLHGRDGFPRSIGTVVCGAIALFLDAGKVCRRHFYREMAREDVAKEAMERPFVKFGHSVAVRSGGQSLLVTSEAEDHTHVILEICMFSGRTLRVIGSSGGGSGPLQFSNPGQIWVCESDGFVFVADAANYRVQVLTPQLEFSSEIVLHRPDPSRPHDLECMPGGVCANSRVVVVYTLRGFVHVYRRVSSSYSSSNVFQIEKKQRPVCTCVSVCFTDDGRDVILTLRHTVAIYGLDGTKKRAFGIMYSEPRSVACTPSGVIIAASADNILLVYRYADGAADETSELTRSEAVCLVGEATIACAVTVYFGTRVSCNARTVTVSNYFMNHSVDAV
jgi:hypothetical protein